MAYLTKSKASGSDSAPKQFPVPKNTFPLQNHIAGTVLPQFAAYWHPPPVAVRRKPGCKKARLPTAALKSLFSQSTLYPFLQTIFTQSIKHGLGHVQLEMVFLIKMVGKRLDRTAAGVDQRTATAAF